MMCSFSCLVKVRTKEDDVHFRGGEICWHLDVDFWTQLHYIRDRSFLSRRRLHWNISTWIRSTSVCIDFFTIFILI